MTTHTLAVPGAGHTSDPEPTANDLVHGSPGWISLRVLGTFDLSVSGCSVPLGATSQRLLTLIVLNSGHLPRSQAAGTLWPEHRGPRAAANLRSALWRLHQCCPDVVDASYHDLRLTPGVTVDLHHVSRVVHVLLDPATELSSRELRDAMHTNLYDDIAPDIGADDWLIAERERFCQLRVHALEALSHRLIRAGWHGAAVEAALGAVRADPFRESAYHLLITAHLAEGSRYEAHRHHATYCALLRAELGLTPSDDFMSLLDNDHNN
ncbi:MAG TPA: BTAD domain-containing putative transcriptional regulator [Pseudonocardiaceae bacterium]|nr:BTAD domain-containing putative transcriptional regulator [Pseudonocardiaceae bacterium]